MPLKWPYILCLILILLTSCYIFYPRIENYFVFFPDRSIDLTPKDLHLDYRDVYFNNVDGERLHGWFFPLKGDCPVILFCHGNAGNISHRLDNIGFLLKENLQVFIFDYRGYGKSSGSPSEKGVYMDGLSAYDYLVKEEHVMPKDIIVFGRSLGGAVAINTVLKKDVRSIIIESGFISTKGMAKSMFLFSMFSFILPPNYNNLEKISGIKVPKLVIHGDEDEIVPFYMGERLFDAAKEPKYFYRLKGAGHNDTYIIGGRKYFQAFASFARDSKI